MSREEADYPKDDPTAPVLDLDSMDVGQGKDADDDAGNDAGPEKENSQAADFEEKTSGKKNARENDEARERERLEEIEKSFRFDPFKDLGGDEDEPEAKPAPKAPKPAAKQPAGPAVDKTPAQQPYQPGAAAQAPDPRDQQIAQLWQMVQGLQGQLQQQQQGSAGQQGQQAQDGQDAQSPENFRFNTGVPPQLMQMLDSEDPNHRTQAIGTIVNGTAQMVYDQVMKVVGDIVEQRVSAVQNTVLQQVETQRTSQSVQDDFYSNYPALNKPALREAVANISRQVVAEMGANGWSPRLRDEIARRAYSEFGWTFPADGNGSKPPNPRPKPPNMSGGMNTRPSGGAAASNPQQADIMDTLFGGY